MYYALSHVQYVSCLKLNLTDLRSFIICLFSLPPPLNLNLNMSIVYPVYSIFPTFFYFQASFLFYSLWLSTVN